MSQPVLKHRIPRWPHGYPASRSFTGGPLQVRQAVTFIETIVVLLILAIAAAAATPRLSGALQGYRLQSAAQRLLADLEMARSFAKVTGRDVSIDFDLANSRYSIVGVESLDTPGAQYEVDLAASPYYSKLSSISLSEASVVEEPEAGGGGELETTTGLGIELTFNRFEQASHQGEIEIQSGTQTIVVVIDAESGESRLKW